jgi:hypothetical protein
MFHKKVFAPLMVLGVFKYIFLAIGIISFIIVVGLVVSKRYKVRPIDTPEPIATTGDETTPLLA